MSDKPTEQVVDNFVGFIHAFGLLRSDTTPCGQAMSVSTAHALCELMNHPASNQRDLASRLGLTASSVSRLVDQLEAKRWAQRIEDDDSTDGRIRLVALTPEGVSVAQQVLRARATRFDSLLEAVPVNKQPMVLEALQLLEEAARVTS